ncbi:AEC family transporter [Mariniblastus fucicola]|uniref:Membrane transport protein n=1 Tax=Mariniblastus fucicola TaxID=980251 RepID=A0A5B9PFS6_9BACT|nr:AEC family transporter [Mariniblastus fucicola]QEG24045.1 Membrane transport protein [Mariniblastus fucicola]
MYFSNILFAAIPVFLTVGIGYCTRIFSVVDDESEKSIMRLIVNVLYPCFILSQVPGNAALQQIDVVVAAIAAGFFLTVVGLILAKSIGHSMKIDPEGVNTFCVSTAIQNYGFIPIPLIYALFQDGATETLGVLFVHNLGLELAMWTIAIVLLSGTMQNAWRRLINGPTIAIVVGLLLNFSGLYKLIPDFAIKTIADLGLCSIPMGLILAGATLAGVVQREKWKLNPKVIVGSLSVRFLIMPAIILVVAGLMTFSPELRNVLIVEAAMPAAIFPIVLAKHFGGKPAIAVEVCVATTLASIVMMPLILGLAMQWFEITLGQAS